MVRGGLLQEDGASHRYTHIQTDSNCSITYYCILPRRWRQFYCDNKVLDMELLCVEYFFNLFSTLTGYFDENFYPAYYEDDDYAIRIHLSQHFYATKLENTPLMHGEIDGSKGSLFTLHTFIYTHMHTHDGGPVLPRPIWYIMNTYNSSKMATLHIECMYICKYECMYVLR